MKVAQIYEIYMIPKNLQEHMLRVAGLAEIILDNWTGENIDKEAIIKACIFHDIAKPMNFDLAKQTQFGMSEEDVVRLAKLQDEIKSKYGTDEHHATVKICKEIGLSPKSVSLVDDLEWKFIPKLIQANNKESLIPIYCDMRIGPKGILSLEKRVEDLRMRTGDEEYKQNMENGMAIETLINENVSIDINSVTEENINARMDRLLSADI